MQLDGHRQLRAPGMMARCGKWPGKKLSLICGGRGGGRRGGALEQAARSMGVGMASTQTSQGRGT